MAKCNGDLQIILGEQHLTLHGEQGDLHLILQGDKHLTGLQGKQMQEVKWQTEQGVQHKQGKAWHVIQHLQGNEQHLVQQTQL